MNLAYFDTALGFVSVMLLLSMLVTILVRPILAGKVEKEQQPAQ